ncbi:hypothetical protein LTR56_017824 [Elasticomyces elasticus]|nr:hypothetical protein LTR56_017824 [Elasticomyces elasticus]KAK4917505.1 hypothetical protein LTR49_014591 [Elasticomyces elasticus]KAK5756371.1 hypothetical protein LTS12_013560 [Elasticomyces elasticus]
MGLHEEKAARYTKLMLDKHLPELAIDFDAAGTANLPAFANPGYPYTSKAPLPTCPEICAVCAQQYLPRALRDRPWMRRIMTMHSDLEAQFLAQQSVTATANHLDVLRAKLTEHGDALLKRWIRKSVAKRAALIRQAMPEAYGGDFAQVRMEYDRQRIVSGAIPKGAGSMTLRDTDNVEQALDHYRDQWRSMQIVHYLDMQTLSEDPSNLLSILHHRSLSTPADWFLFDLEHTRVAFDRILENHVYNPHCVIMYGKHYGKLIAWNKNSAHHQDICGYPRAMLTLEVQNILSKSLRSIVDLILAPSLEDAAKGREQWDLLAASDFQYRQASGTLSRHLGAYRAAPTFDIKAIVGILRERLEALTDELTQLQTDPLLFRAYLSQIHGTEIYETYDELTRTRATISTTLGCAVWMLFFRAALHHAENLLSVQEQYQAQIHPGKQMPAPYEGALILLRRFLLELFEGQLQDLCGLKTLGKNFQRQLSLIGGTSSIEMSDEELFQKRLLLWNLDNISECDELTVSPTFHLEWINKIISGRAGADSEPVDDVFGTHLANMTAVDEVLTALRYHRPQPVAADDSKTVRDAESQCYGNLVPEKHDMQYAGMAKFWPGEKRIWPALKTFLNLPLPSSKISSTSLARHRALRQALEHFWETVVDIMTKAGVTTYQTPTELILNHRFTQEYKDHAAEEDRRLERAVRDLDARARNLLSTTPDSLLRSPQKLQQTNVEPRPSRIEPKQKPKTRPADNNQKNEEGIAAQLAAVELQEPKATISVRSQSLELFERMFTASVAESSDINWEQLVAAMVDAGCAATPNGGSAVTFRQCSGEKSVIGFHRPHDSKVNPVMLKAMGRRLSKRFDWDAETFVMREKEDGKEGDA